MAPGREFVLRPSECGGQSADGCEADCFQVVVGSRRGASDQEMKLEPLLAEISVKPPTLANSGQICGSPQQERPAPIASYCDHRAVNHQQQFPVMTPELHCDSTLL